MRKGQEEIVGFVAVLILLGIVFLVFIGLSIRNNSNDLRENSEAYFFLSSVMETTSDCERNFEGNYIDLADLIVACSKNEACLNGNSCEILNSTVGNLVELGFKPGPDSPVKAATISFRAVNSSEFLTLRFGGNCTGSVSGASYTIPSNPRSVINEIKLCS